MTLSPKKYVSHYTSSAVHRGVEAKQAEVSDTRTCRPRPASLTLDASSSTHLMAESSAASTGAVAHAVASPPLPADETGSYLQVVVEKHRRKRAAPPATSRLSPRLPAASSPLPAAQGVHACGASGACGAGGVYVVPPPLLLACAAGAPLCPAHAYYQRSGAGESRALADAPHALNAPHAPGAGDGQAACAPPDGRNDPDKKSKSWKLFRDVGVNETCDDGPECVEVYYFERGSGDFLATHSGARPTACERAAGRGARVAGALLAELLAAPRLLAALPVAVLLHIERCALMSVRYAVTGAVQTASDYALKPVLALAFNSLCAPLLVCAGQAARGVRDALAPLAQALDALAEPPARLLRALRLVEVRLHCPHHAPALP